MSEPCHKRYRVVGPDEGRAILLHDGRVLWIFPKDKKQLQTDDYRDSFDFATATVLMNLIRLDHPEWSPRVEGYFDFGRAVGITVLVILCLLGFCYLARLLGIDLGPAIPSDMS